MIKITNLNAKKQYEYERYNVDEINETLLKDLINLKANLSRNKRRKGSNKNIKSFKIGGGKKAKSYLDICCSFDIETYTNQETKLANMYIWQFGLNGVVIIGRTWEEFVDFLDMFQKVLKLSTNQRVLVWVHNLGFEFQWCRKWLNIDDAEENFFKEQREPLFFTHNHTFVFQDSYAMTNSSLARLAEDYTNTQKCVNDLDYNVPRSSLSILSDTEMSYVDNDVLVLCEWAEYYNNTFLSKGVKPLTLTAVLYLEVGQYADDYCKKLKKTKQQLMNYLGRLKCKTEAEYKFTMNFVYRGGYCHANELYVGDIFDEDDNIFGFDFTSSYPAVMLLAYFPISEFKYVDCKNEDELKVLCEKYCVIMDITLYGVESKTDQTIESSSKCIKLTNSIIDNGRVRSASEMRVGLTELDYETYCEFYTWNSKLTKIHSVAIAKSGRLIDYLIKPMLKYYILKDELKKAGMPYGIEKSKVNTFYGLCCKRLNETMCMYSDDKWYDTKAKSYEEQNSKSLLSPYFGVYVSAHARRNLLKTVYKLESAGKSVLYCDTDSLKILQFDDVAKAIIDEYNKDIENRLHKACEYWDINFESVHDLGMFDHEYGSFEKGVALNKVIKFKTLGAKRYLITYYGKNKKTGEIEIKHNQTVAGLPKNFLFKNCKDWKKVYDDFDNNMIVEDCKTTAKYIDDEYTAFVDGVAHTEKSGLALVNSNFSMKLDKIWLVAFKDYQEQFKHREFRI